MTLAHKKGFNAFYDFRGIDDNDYADGTDAAMEWTEGWLEAERYNSVVDGVI